MIIVEYIIGFITGSIFGCLVWAIIKWWKKV